MALGLRLHKKFAYSLIYFSFVRSLTKFSHSGLSGADNTAARGRSSCAMGQGATQEGTHISRRSYLIVKLITFSLNIKYNIHHVVQR